LAVLVCAPLCAAPVPARPKADDAPPATATKLLEHRKVQKELKMTAEQRVELLDALADADEAFEKKFEELAKLPNPPDEAFDKLDREQEHARAKAYAAAANGLTAAQRARLNQLDLRVRGVAALADPAVERALQLTDAQKKKAKDAIEQLKAQVEKYLDGDGDDETDEQRRDKLFAFRAERLKDAEAALTKEQQAAWARMLGDKPAALDLNDLWLRAEEDAELFAPKP
jgi:hypothetical protein